MAARFVWLTHRVRHTHPITHTQIPSHSSYNKHERTEFHKLRDQSIITIFGKVIYYNLFQRPLKNYRSHSLCLTRLLCSFKFKCLRYWFAIAYPIVNEINEATQTHTPTERNKTIDNRSFN